MKNMKEQEENQCVFLSKENAVQALFEYYVKLRNENLPILMKQIPEQFVKVQREIISIVQLRKQMEKTCELNAFESIHHETIIELVSQRKNQQTLINELSERIKHLQDEKASKIVEALSKRQQPAQINQLKQQALKGFDQVIFQVKELKRSFDHLSTKKDSATSRQEFKNQENGMEDIYSEQLERIKVMKDVHAMKYKELTFREEIVQDRLKSLEEYVRSCDELIDSLLMEFQKQKTKEKRQKQSPSEVQTEEILENHRSTQELISVYQKQLLEAGIKIQKMEQLNTVINNSREQAINKEEFLRQEYESFKQISNNRILELESQNTLLQEDINRLRKEKQTYICSTESTVSGLNNRISALDSVIISLKEEIAVLNQKGVDGLENQNKLKTQIENHKTQIKNFKKKLKQSESKFKQTQSELKQTQLKLKQNQSKLKQYQSNNQQKQQDLKQNQSKLKQTESNLKQTQSKLKQTESKLKQTVKQIQSKLKQTQSKLKQAESKLKQNESKHKQNESILPKLERDNQLLQKQVKQSKIDKTNLQSQLRQKQEAIKFFENELTKNFIEFTSQKKSLQQSILEYQYQVAQAKTLNKELEEQITHLKTQALENPPSQTLNQQVLSQLKQAIYLQLSKNHEESTRLIDDMVDRLQNII